ncbi:MAG TPA: glycerophosphodiester phosphodiesterase [Frankiaceae bacterium]|nr:glycerophosphodiester phosphodiesterase [Frankiaceae bacterium]
MLIVGHRGAADAAHPENTVAAVDRALRLGADGVEVDVRLTADGAVVCLHDPTLARVAGIDRDVTAMTRRMVAGVRLAGGHEVPGLADVVAAVRGRGRLVVEMKTTPWGTVGGAEETAVAVAGVLRRLAVTRQSDVVVSSFDRDALACLRRHLPVRTGVLTPQGVPAAAAVRWVLDGGHDEAHPHVRAVLADPGVVSRAHALGVAVVTWTVNRRADIRRLALAGVDAVISDDTAAARAAASVMTCGSTRRGR